jgi:hypothetical protein
MSAVTRAGWAYERAGAASMVYNLRQHRRARMLRLAAAYGEQA